MAINIINGVPGIGKTTYVSYLAKQHYDKENRLSSKVLYFIFYKIKCFKVYLKNILRKLFKRNLLSYPIYKYSFSFYNEYGKINNVYTTYPVLLDAKNNVYSNIISLYDLNNNSKVLPYSVIIIDEVPLFIDSDEYIDKQTNAIFRPIARFLQSHRHFGIKDIYFVAHHPCRVMKKVRNVTECFYKITHFIKIPIIKIGIITMVLYYTFEDYGKSVKVKKELINFDYKKKFKFVNLKVFNIYESTYLHVLNDDKPLLNRGTWTQKSMTKDEAISLFSDTN